MVNISRRVSYIIPAPTEDPPYLSLPPIDQNRRSHPQPFLNPKDDLSNGSNGDGLASNNPFASPDDLDRIPSPSNTSTKHPRHCLGLTSLALDTSTLLHNTSSPGGILYSGGRDGLVCAWELNVPHKRRRGGRYEIMPGRGSRTKWEKVGDGAEFFEDDEDFEQDEEEEEDRGDSSDEEEGQGEVPYEDRWEVDKDAIASRPPAETTFRQSAQTHTDWVNALLLCNYNQTVITASSDRTIRAWSPHATTDEAGLSPSLVGTHRDYVRALAWAKYPALLFSGSLDRKLNLWDVQGGLPDSPVMSINMDIIEDYGGVGMEGERGSVYALGVDHTGGILAAGTPERVIRLWDPRSGERSVGKLIGHSDCVRSILVSEDGRYMLTGSSDTTVKLWSLGEHRCIHTFAHHTSSVWSLFSNHPNLERFYSGSRDGHVCAVDVEQITDMSDGECVVLARDSATSSPVGEGYESKSGDEGIRAIVGMDDEYVWTANGSADIKRWRDVGRRIHRSTYDGARYNGFAMEDDDNEKVVVSPPALQPEGIRRVSVDDPLVRIESRDSRAIAFAPDSASRADAPPPQVTFRERLGVPSARRTTESGAPFATSIATVSSVDGVNGDDGPSLNGLPFASLVPLGMSDSPYSLGFHERDRAASISSVRNGYDGHVNGHTADEGSAARAFEHREVASEARPLRKRPDAVIAGRPGLIRSLILNDRLHVLTVDTEGEVTVWNIIQGRAVGRFSAADLSAALDLEKGIEAGAAVRKHSNEVLELVKHRVEGETMVITWCSVDTKIGSLVVHLEESRVWEGEVYADQVGIDGETLDTRINLGKWALANLFRGLIQAEERDLTASPGSQPQSRSPASLHISIERPQSLSPPHRRRALSNISSAPSLNIAGIATPAATPAILPDLDYLGSSPNSVGLLSRSAPTLGFQSFNALRNGLSAIPQSPHGLGPPATGGSIIAGSVSPGVGETRGDYFSQRKRPDHSPARESVPATTPGGASEKDKSVKDGSTGTGSKDIASSAPTPGLMGKLKGFGKKKEKETAMTAVKEEEVVKEEEKPAPVDPAQERENVQLAILDTVRSHPFRPPPPWEAPPLEYPPTTALLISEESKDAGAWVVTYRSNAGSTGKDMEAIEWNAPLWLLDYLFTSRIRLKDPVKLTFILEPVPNCGLPAMPEGTSRLSASRVLRARKVLAFIYDKLDLGAAAAAHRGRQSSVASLNSRITALPFGNKSGTSAMAIPGGGRGAAGNANANATNLNRHASPNQQAQTAGETDQPEDMIELVCGDTVVDPLITLAALKQYYGSGGDMLLLYRPKKHA